MERLKHMKEALMCCVEGQMGHLDKVDAKELGEAIDMLKDLEEAIYYATITKAMNEPADSWDKHRWSKKHKEDWDDEDWDEDDMKEGRSGRVRRLYMVGKEKHHDTAAQMRELEKYMKELSEDILDMIKESTLEEKQYLSKKITMLASKIEAAG